MKLFLLCLLVASACAWPSFSNDAPGKWLDFCHSLTWITMLQNQLIRRQFPSLFFFFSIFVWILTTINDTYFIIQYINFIVFLWAIPKFRYFTELENRPPKMHARRLYIRYGFDRVLHFTFLRVLSIYIVVLPFSTAAYNFGLLVLISTMRWAKNCTKNCWIATE